MGKKATEYDPGAWQDVENRVSRLEDVREALERAVVLDRTRLVAVESVAVPKLGRDVTGLESRLDNLDEVTFPLITGEIGRMKKRLARLEKKEIPNLAKGCVENHDRLNDQDRRMTELEDEWRDK